MSEVKDILEPLLDLWRTLAQATPICQGALAKDFEMARFVHDLCGHEQLRLVVGSINLTEPPARHITSDKFHLGKEGAELAHGMLNILGQWL